MKVRAFTSFSFGCIVFFAAYGGFPFPGGIAAQPKTKATVLVLGGGYAGLQAAYTLKQNGVDFLLLEANDYVGGRSAASGATDASPASTFLWIRDPNPEYDPARPFMHACGLNTSETISLANRIVDDTGRDVTPSSKDRANEFADIISKVSLDFDSGKITDSNSPTMRSFFTLYGWHKKDPIDWYIEWENHNLDFGPTSESSAMHYFYLYGTKGKNLNVFYESMLGQLKSPQAFAECVRRLTFTADIADRLRLNTLVTSVSYSDTGVSVETQDGTTYEGDYAIITFSIGVLQQSVVDFKPEIPFWKRLAWSEFAMMPVTQMYALFNTSLPFEHHLYAYVTHDVNPISVYDFSQQIADIHPNFTNASTFTFTDLYMIGHLAARFDRQPWEKTVAEVNAMFRLMFGTEPYFLDKTNTTYNPLFLGGYAMWPVGASWSDFDAVRKPVGRLHFAGEHCSYLRELRGSLLSGKETANVVTSCINGESCNQYEQFSTADVPEECPTTSKSYASASSVRSIVCIALIWFFALM